MALSASPMLVRCSASTGARRRSARPRSSAPAQAAVAPAAAAPSRRSLLLGLAACSAALPLPPALADPAVTVSSTAAEGVPPAPDTKDLKAWKVKAKEYTTTLRNLAAVATEEGLSNVERLSAKEECVRAERNYAFKLRKVTVSCRGEPCYLAGLGEIQEAERIITSIERRKVEKTDEEKVQDFFVPKLAYPNFTAEERKAIEAACDAADKQL